MPIPANFRHCFITAALAAGARHLDESKLESKFQLLQDRMARYKNEFGLDDTQAAMRAGRELGEEASAAATVKRLNALQDLQKRVDRRQRIVDRAEGVFAEGTRAMVRRRKVSDISAAIRGEIEALNTPTEMGRMSAEAYSKTRFSQYQAGVEHELSATPGLKAAARSGKIDDAIAAELYALNHPNETPGVSKNAQAKQIAAILHKYATMAKTRLNEQGAWIGDYDGYITRTTHDQAKIRRATQDAWINDTLPLLDARTFEGVTDSPREFLGKLWNEFVAGYHISDAGGVGFKAPAFSGPGNLARQLSAERVLHFKDAASWHSYQKAYGHSGSLTEQVMTSLRRASRNEALMDRWGTNPQASFENDVQWLKEKYLDTSPQAVAQLNKGEEGLRNLFDQLTGEANRPANEMGAQISAFTRNIASMSRLGFMVWSDLFSGIVVKAPQMRYQGANLLEAYGNVFSSFFRSFNGSDRGESMKLMLAALGGTHSGLGSFGWFDDSFPGTFTKITNNYFRATGSNYILNSQKRGSMWLMSNILGRQIGKDFDTLMPETKRAFMQYGIGREEWDALRSAPDHPMESGNTFLTPDAAMRSPANLTAQERDKLALKLQAYYTDVADSSMIEPGIGDRALWLHGTRPGTVDGEAWRFVMQFKLWPTAMVRQFWGRQMYGGANFGGIASGIMGTVVMGMLAGYMRNYMVDSLKGLQPRPADDYRTWLAALSQSGGFGILGDYLFGQSNRFGGGIFESAAGPVAGNVADAFRIWNDIKDQSTSHPGRAAATGAIRLGVNNAPFANLFYVRAALNYLFLHSLMETMNPGYLRRAEEAQKKATGRGFIEPSTPGIGWMAPRAHLQTFGR